MGCGLSSVNRPRLQKRGTRPRPRTTKKQDRKKSFTMFYRFIKLSLFLRGTPSKTERFDLEMWHIRGDLYAGRYAGESNDVYDLVVF